ncbi:hypothetical protein POM88_041257 [Heracleum sosnowskyi]|uniref:Uncharacterized protein n=1 Tax=Heracleum sosnowskyi TaxID=360622 RepID=A0AAD8HFV0_9APIA|nr:hypothetical protein POM88_041257 [Heracleum sosnowskyi]
MDDYGWVVDSWWCWSWDACRDLDKQESERGWRRCRLGVWQIDTASYHKKTSYGIFSRTNQKLSDDDNPSAPPFSDAGGEIKQEQSPVSTRPNGMPSAAAAVATNGFERKTRTTSLQNNIRQETNVWEGKGSQIIDNVSRYSKSLLEFLIDVN